MSLKYGSKVRVTMARNDVFSWQMSRTFDAVLISGPAGPGDTYHLKLPSGRGVLLNGNSQEFVAIHECEWEEPGQRAPTTEEGRE